MAFVADTRSGVMWDLWMQRALQLAALADGYTSPNPLVGAVVLDCNDQLVGEGFHARAGLPHAEVGALAQAGAASEGGTLVVTLEPCCHQGRTPPCTEAILAAGIKRVVVALEDPDPRVAGGGMSRLRHAGLEVIDGVLRSEALRQNRAFLHRVRTGRPWGILKWAMGLDGRTALPNGVSQWITGPLARKSVHRLRGCCDAVIVGGGTVRADDPLLTSRGCRTPEPWRVVISRSLDLPVDAQLWDQAVAPTWVAHGPEARQGTVPAGPKRLPLETCDPLHLMQELAQHGCNRVLWECGPELAAEAVRQDCVQEFAVFIAPKMMGGVPARTPLGDLGLTSMEQVAPLTIDRMQWLDKDVLIQVRSEE